MRLVLSNLGKWQGHRRSTMISSRGPQISAIIPPNYSAHAVWIMVPFLCNCCNGITVVGAPRNRIQ